MPTTQEDVIAKVQKLLAQAQNTTYEEEARAFTEKAQELISTWQIDEAVLESRREVKVDPILKKFYIDPPFRNSKSDLLGTVAQYNDCKTAYHSGHTSANGRGFFAVSVVGLPADVDFVEMLYTSLSMQLTNEMIRTPISGTYYDYEEDREKRVHGKTFRKNFIDGFTCAVGRRLSEAKSAARKAATMTEVLNGEPQPETGPETSSVALAILDKSKRVEHAYGSFFPKLGHRSAEPATKNRSGFSQGSAAGQRANLSGKSMGSQKAIGQ
jgi:hypothetical protein